MDRAAEKAEKKEWRTSDLIEAYWAVQTDESLRLPGSEAVEAAEARHRAYRRYGWSGSDFFYQHPAAGWWDQQ